MPQPTWFAESLPILIEGNELPAALMVDAIRAMASGPVDDAQAAAFLIALRIKGETAREIGAAVGVLREKMVRIERPAGTILDTCGTGGDGSGTFNISTAVALIVAATGCPVVKHGNRSVSSRSGSADVLAELGVPIERGPTWAQSCLDRFGFAFCFAPQFHPALAHIGPLRRKLGTRTIFNLLGPLLNPASAECQLLGVGRLELLDPLAGAASLLGIHRAFLVCADDGLDEVSLAAPTQVRWVCGHDIEKLRWTPANFGLEPCRIEDLKADGPKESAGIILHILAGEGGPHERIVLANAAAALLVVGKVGSLLEGVAAARQAIGNGAAKRLLEQLCAS